jgi:hypothetical protein
MIAGKGGVITIDKGEETLVSTEGKEVNEEEEVTTEGEVIEEVGEEAEVWKTTKEDSAAGAEESEEEQVDRGF